MIGRSLDSSRILQQPDIKLYIEVILLKKEGSPKVISISFFWIFKGHAMAWPLPYVVFTISGARMQA